VLVLQRMLLPDVKGGAGIPSPKRGVDSRSCIPSVPVVVVARVALAPALTSKEPTLCGALASTALLPTIPQPCTATRIHEQVQNVRLNAACGGPISGLDAWLDRIPESLGGSGAQRVPANVPPGQPADADSAGARFARLAHRGLPPIERRGKP
jgi:hypothetical protein